MSLGKAVVKMCVMDEEMAKYATAEADNALSCMFHEKVGNQQQLNISIGSGPIYEEKVRSKLQI